MANGMQRGDVEGFDEANCFLDDGNPPEPYYAFCRHYMSG